MQSPTNQPQAKTTFLQRSVTFAILAVVVVCGCIALLAVFASQPPNRSAKPTPSATAVPQEVGATVVFNVPTKTSTPQPTEGPTLAPLGNSRTNPYPVDVVVDIGSGMELTILRVERPADQTVANGNRFNDTPEPDKEYIIVWVRIECIKASEETCNFTRTSIKTVGIDGQIRERAFVAGIPQEIESAEFFGGGALQGNLPFLARVGDTETVLMFEPFLFGEPVYIALQ